MKTPQTTRFSNKAFTIVELIIVVAVIGILAAITIVTYTSTRNQADKSSYNASAQQVKMKLGEHYTDNNHYPSDKSDLLSYLNDVGSATLEDNFSSSDYQYEAYSSSAKNPCSSDDCQYYEITVPKTVWNGNSEDSDIVVKP